MNDQAASAVKAARDEVYRLQDFAEQGGRAYCEAMEEWARRDRDRGRLDVEASLAQLKEAARLQRCTTYGALASASGQKWTAVRHDFDRRSGHMDLLLGLCCVRRLPLLTTLCVTAKNLVERKPTDMELNGFEAGARRQGLRVTDAEKFFLAEQQRALRWGALLNGR